MHPARKIDRILALANPGSVLDVGCGTGQSLMHFKGRGLDVLGVEASKIAISNSACPGLIRRHDLRKPLHLHRSFDLVWCFEVAEHIHPKFVDVFLGSLVRHSAVVVMSAASPGQGGEGHLNEQPQCYWENKFANLDYFLHPQWTIALREVDEFYSQNMMVFTQSI